MFAVLSLYYLQMRNDEILFLIETAPDVKISKRLCAAHIFENERMHKMETSRMEYEIVTLEEKTAMGLTARTNNNAPDMGIVIGGLWEKFFNEGVYMGIRGKVNEKTLGIYSDYDSDEKGDYNITVACEVEPGTEALQGTVIKKIPAGKYAKFVVEGNMEQAAGAFWNNLWAMELNRSFICDFEEYQNSDPEHTVIHMYISITG